MHQQPDLLVNIWRLPIAAQGLTLNVPVAPLQPCHDGVLDALRGKQGSVIVSAEKQVSRRRQRWA